MQRAPAFRRQLDLKHARVHAFKDRNHSLEHHLAPLVIVADANAHFSGQREEKEIRNADSIDGGDKRNGNAAAHFLDIVEMLHDLDEAEHRAEDADGG